MNSSEANGATRREFYEAPMSTHLVSSDRPSAGMNFPVTAADESATGNESTTSRKGYWDIISTFRSSKMNSST